jgi:hypothetical protein
MPEMERKALVKERLVNQLVLLLQMVESEAPLILLLRTTATIVGIVALLCGKEEVKEAISKQFLWNERRATGLCPACGHNTRGSVPCLRCEENDRKESGAQYMPPVVN